MDKNSEKYLERKLCAEVKKLGGIAYKFVSPGRRGVPDRMVALPHSQTVFVELKSEGKKPTPLQEIEIKRLEDLDFCVYVVDSYESLQELLVQLRDLVKLSGSLWNALQNQ